MPEIIMRALGLAAVSLLLTAAAPPDPARVAAEALDAAPVWDGHNDVPEQLRDRRRDVLGDFDFRDTLNTADPAKALGAMHTDLTRLHAGHVGAQFWSVFVSAGLPEPQAVQATLEQIDVMKRLIARYPGEMRFCTSAAEVEAARKAGRIASLLGAEGGHSIGGSLGVLRQFHALGVRYLTLTHFRNTAWADSATDAPAHGGLTDFGKQVVREMQRLGMLVDLSHTSAATMKAALAVARAPVIFSHSGAQAVDGSPRNVPDDVLDLLKTNGGVIMVDAYPSYVSEKVRQWQAARAAEEARLKVLFPGDPVAAKAGLAKWAAANPAAKATVSDVADHIEHIARRIGADHVGLGGDYDGMEIGPEGMHDVAGYPALFTELARRGFTKAELMQLASGNTLRVLRAAEAYAAAHAGDAPEEAPTAF
ncbi:MAG: dipeptidase [Sphingomonadales bacterium]|nr:dipeptidase [Sphingomonadales bacterium]